jgi:hypothetical protein
MGLSMRSVSIEVRNTTPRRSVILTVLSLHETSIGRILSTVPFGIRSRCKFRKSNLLRLDKWRRYNCHVLNYVRRHEDMRGSGGRAEVFLNHPQ